jgi:hypothetical protein
MADRLTVELPVPAPPDLAGFVSTQTGFPTRVVGATRGPDYAVVFAVVAGALVPLFNGMLQQFGTESANRLMAVIDRLRNHARAGARGNPVEVRLVDEANDITVVIDENVNSQAVAALFALQRDAYRPDTELRWDSRSRQWTASRSA